MEAFKATNFSHDGGQVALSLHFFVGLLEDPSCVQHLFQIEAPAPQALENGSQEAQIESDLLFESVHNSLPSAENLKGNIHDVILVDVSIFNAGLGLHHRSNPVLLKLFYFRVFVNRGSSLNYLIEVFVAAPLLFRQLGEEFLVELFVCPLLQKQLLNKCCLVVDVNVVAKDPHDEHRHEPFQATNVAQHLLKVVTLEARTLDRVFKVNIYPHDLPFFRSQLLIVVPANARAFECFAAVSLDLDRLQKQIQHRGFGRVIENERIAVETRRHRVGRIGNG